MVGSAPRHVVVVGGGMAGITAARTLVRAGAAVTLLEAGPRLGGSVRTVAFGEQQVDVGAEALHTAAPAPLELVEELGLGGELVPARPAPTWIASGDRLRRLPGGVGPAGPTRLAPLARSGLLGPTGLLRAAMEPLVRHPHPAGDVPVGEALGRRFGDQVVDRLVDPLLGGLHAGDVHRLSVQAATPHLAASLARRRSLVLAGRGRRRASHGFVTLRGGLGRLVEAAAARTAADVVTSARVRTVADAGDGRGRYVVRTDEGVEHVADGVVLALPAAGTASVLADLDATASSLLRPSRTASVAVVLLAYPADVATAPALAGTGVLVPSGEGRLLKAATFLTTKWPHLSGSPHVLVRASTGRVNDTRSQVLDEASLVARLADDLSAVAGLVPPPVQHMVVRWPGAMPQLEVGHLQRVAELRERLAAHPGIAVAGAAIDGVGIAAAMRSGATAATHVVDHLHGAAA